MEMRAGMFAAIGGLLVETHGIGKGHAEDMVVKVCETNEDVCEVVAFLRS